MNKNVLDFINKLEGFKTGLKSLHWDADNLSQHKLCDDIADRLSDFQDQVSEVEQSIHGNISKNELNGVRYEVSSLKKFVNDVISATEEFYKGLSGDEYIGMRSDCESFLSDMQRNLYLVNFTMKEDFKRSFKAKINESRPKNPLSVGDSGFEKFMGRNPKSIKTRINRIYKIVKKYGIDSRVYKDEHWQAINDYYEAISSLGCDVNIYPCANLNKPDWDIQGDGGYCDYDENDHMPHSKQYKVIITYDDGMKVEGYIKCMAAGTVEDPFKRYDTCIVLWPKSTRELEMEGKEMRRNSLNETELNYDVDNFSGRNYRMANVNNFDPAELDAYLDDPIRKNAIEYDLDTEAWENGDTRQPEEIQNEYSWDLHDRQPIAPGVGGFYSVAKGAIPREVDDAIEKRNNELHWTPDEEKRGETDIARYVNGSRSLEGMKNAWRRMHEGKIKVTESELKSLLRESVKNVLMNIREMNELYSEWYDKEDYDGNTGEEGMVRSYDIGTYYMGQAEEDAKENGFDDVAKYLEYWFSEIQQECPWYWQKVGNGYGYNGDTIFRNGGVVCKDIYGQIIIDEYPIGDARRNAFNESINIDPKNKGKFTATKKRTGKSTEELKHSKNPLTRKRAVFAANAKKWNHKKNNEGVEMNCNLLREFDEHALEGIDSIDARSINMYIREMIPLGGKISVNSPYKPIRQLVIFFSEDGARKHGTRLTKDIINNILSDEKIKRAVMRLTKCDKEIVSYIYGSKKLTGRPLMQRIVWELDEIISALMELNTAYEASGVKNWFSHTDAIKGTENRKRVGLRDLMYNAVISANKIKKMMTLMQNLLDR